MVNQSQTGEIKVVQLTKTEQIRMCGNSVCPPLAQALAAANSADLSAWNKDNRRRLSRLKIVAA